MASARTRLAMLALTVGDELADAVEDGAVQGGQLLGGGVRLHHV